MGFRALFERFRKQPEPDLVRLTLEDIPGWVSQELAAKEHEERAVLDTLAQMTRTCTEAIRAHAEALKDVDIRQRVTDKRVLSIVHGNVKKYRAHLAMLTEKLRQTQEESLSSQAAALTAALVDFFEKSRMNYEKATILVGKEMADAHSTVKSYGRDVQQEVDAHAALIARTAQLHRIKDILDAITENDAVIAATAKEITKTATQVTDARARKKTLEKEIVRTKNGAAYTAYAKRLEERDRARIAAERARKKLHAHIDFKALAHVFHGSARMMPMVKEYRQDFLGTYAKDNGARLRALLEEAGMLTEELQRIMRTITEQEAAAKKNPGVDPAAPAMAEQQELHTRITALEEHRETESRKRERLLTIREEHLRTLEETLQTVHVQLARPDKTSP